jgi:hypothetical protein
MRMSLNLLHYDVRQMPSRTFSARWDAGVVDRLERRSESTGTNKSRLTQRYVDEGIQMDEHPGVIFRDGPAGRRAGLAGSIDIWEVIMVLRGLKESGDEAITVAAELLDLREDRIRTAIDYHQAYPAEVDEWLAFHFADADAAEAAWLREQDALT